MKALSKDRTKRFESMDKLNRVLVKFLYSRYPDFNASDLSCFSGELFKEEIKEDRKKLFEYGKIDIKPYIRDMERELSGKNINDNTVKVKNVSKQNRRVISFEDDKDTVNYDDLKSSFTKSVYNKKVGETTNAKFRKFELAKDECKGAGLGKRGMTEDLNPNQKVVNNFNDDGLVAKANNNNFLKVCFMGGAAALAFAVFKFNDQNKSPVIVTEKVPVESVRNPSSGNDKSVEYTNITLRNFDRRSMFAYIDGSYKKPDVINQIKVIKNKAQVLRG